MLKIKTTNKKKTTTSTYNKTNELNEIYWMKIKLIK
jgi:hypothetical protein